MVGGLGNATGGKVVWLRGGGAVYHVHSMNGTSTSVTVYTSTYTDNAKQSFAPKTTPEVISVRWPGYTQGADYATSAGNADTVDGQHFSYSNSSNSPTYLWATNSNGSSFLAARGSISVNYANSAGTAGSADNATNASNLKHNSNGALGAISFYVDSGVSETLVPAPSYCKPAGVDSDGNTMILRMRWSSGAYGHDIYICRTKCTRIMAS